MSEGDVIHFDWLFERRKVINSCRYPDFRDHSFFFVFGNDRFPFYALSEFRYSILLKKKAETRIKFCLSYPSTRIRRTIQKYNFVQSPWFSIGGIYTICKVFTKYRGRYWPSCRESSSLNINICLFCPQTPIDSVAFAICPLFQFCISLLGDIEFFGKFLGPLFLIILLRPRSCLNNDYYI